MLLALFALLLRLGFWQLARAEQKESAESDFVARQSAPPLAIQSLYSHQSAAAIVHRGVEGEGEFIVDRQFLLDNRTHAGVAGYHVITLLRPRQGSELLLVNRGWVPVGGDRQRLPDLSLPTGTLTIAGTVAQPSTTTYLLGDAGYAGSIWPRVVQVLDPTQVAHALSAEVAPLMVLLSPEQPFGFVREWRPYLGISPERHRAYAFQWFALAATLVTLWLLFLLRARSPTGEASSK